MGNKISSVKNEEEIIKTKEIIQNFVDKLDYNRNYNKDELVNILKATYDEININNNSPSQNIDQEQLQELQLQEQLLQEQKQQQQLEEQQQQLQEQQRQQLQKQREQQLQEQQREQLQEQQQLQEQLQIEKNNNIMNINLENDKTKLNKLVDEKRKLTDYNIFVKENLQKIKEEYPDLPTKEIMKIVAKKWNQKNGEQLGGGNLNKDYMKAKNTVKSLEERMRNISGGKNNFRVI